MFWSSGVFTGLGGVDGDHTTKERTFIIVMLITCLVILTAFISTFTSSLTHLAIISRTVKDQFSQLHKYMHQHAVSSALCARITQNAKFALEIKERHTPEEDVRLLELVSDPLRRDLHYEIYGHQVARHPLFKLVD